MLKKERRVTHKSPAWADSWPVIHTQVKTKRSNVLCAKFWNLIEKQMRMAVKNTILYEHDLRD